MSRSLKAASGLGEGFKQSDPPRYSLSSAESELSLITVSVLCKTCRKLIDVDKTFYTQGDY